MDDLGIVARLEISFIIARHAGYELFLASFSKGDRLGSPARANGIRVSYVWEWWKLLTMR